MFRQKTAISTVVFQNKSIFLVTHNDYVALAQRLISSDAFSVDLNVLKVKRIKRKLLEAIGNEPQAFAIFLASETLTADTNALTQLFCSPRHVGNQALPFLSTSSSRELANLCLVMKTLKEDNLKMPNDLLLESLYRFGETGLHRGDAYLNRARRYAIVGRYVEALRDFKMAEASKLHSEKKEDLLTEINACYAKLGCQKSSAKALQLKPEDNPTNEIKFECVMQRFETPLPWGSPSGKVRTNIIAQTRTTNPLVLLRELIESGVLTSHQIAATLNYLSRPGYLMVLISAFDDSETAKNMCALLEAMSLSDGYKAFITNLRDDTHALAQQIKAHSRDDEDTKKLKEKLRDVVSGKPPEPDSSSSDSETGLTEFSMFMDHGLAAGGEFELTSVTTTSGNRLSTRS